MAERRPCHLGILKKETTCFFLCDIQEKFRPAMLHFAEVVENAKRLVEVSKVLQVPLIVTEQYPKGLGNTVADIDIQHAVNVFPKTKFSMMIPEVREALENLKSRNIESIVLFGVEAHVCVEQTALDLLQEGYTVHIVADASTSRTQEDRLLAFDRLKQVGCFVTTGESVIYKLIGDKENPQFNELRPLFKNPTKETGLVAKIFSRSPLAFEKPVFRSVKNKPKKAENPETKGTPRKQPEVSSTDLKCKFCEKKFGRKQELKRHMKMHEKSSDFLCETCGLSFRSRAGLLYHTAKQHSQTRDRFACERCQKTFSNELQLTTHAKNVHHRAAESRYKCRICEKVFTRSDVFKNHLEIHSSLRKTFSCGVCNKTFTSKSNLRTHTRTHDSLLRVQCDFCKAKFRSAKKLTSHRVKCSQTRSLTYCSLCDLSFSTEQEYSDHLRVKHPADYAITAVFGNSLEKTLL